MKFLLIGGDERAIYLSGLLKNAGAEVCCYALDMARLPAGVFKTEALERADVYILPLPCEKKGALNAPFTAKMLKTSELLNMLPPKSVVFGGKMSETLLSLGKSRGMKMHDLMKSEPFAVKNAAITAEGAVSLLAQNMKRCLFGAEILVIGYGRIGRILSQKLHSLGARVWVLSGNEASRAHAECAGMRVFDGEVGRFAAVFNTAPAPVLKNLEGFGQDCVFLELASVAGLDPNDCAKRCLLYVRAAGLPARYAPESAARVIFDEIYSALGEF